ncbi:hypothetical protein II582_01640 [bacterium]|nr:hypothetical protein [bacterium]
MKRLLIVLAIVIAMAKMSIAQNVEHNVEVGVSSSVMYSSKNASVGTGLVFSEDPAVISQLNVSVSYNKWAVSAYYSGYTGIQRLSVGDQYHLVDLLASYNITDGLTLHVGPEFTYKDTNESDIVGSGLVAMMTWSKNNFDATVIYYTDPHFSIHYVIGSADYRIIDYFSAYGLFGYTTAEQTPVYGMLGMKYTKNEFFAGVYYMFRENAPGPHFNVGFKF